MMVFSTVPDLLINGTSYSFSSFDLMKPSSSTSFVSDYPVAGWLLGNLLEMKNSSTSSNGGNVEYWQALKHLILQLPSSAFPSPASPPLCSSTISDHGQRHVGLGNATSATGPVDAFDAFRKRQAGRYTEVVMTSKAKMGDQQFGKEF